MVQQGVSACDRWCDLFQQFVTDSTQRLLLCSFTPLAVAASMLILCSSTWSVCATLSEAAAGVVIHETFRSRVEKSGSTRRQASLQTV
eukprot:1595483-Amphidinium_carterae.1